MDIYFHILAIVKSDCNEYGSANISSRFFSQLLGKYSEVFGLFLNREKIINILLLLGTSVYSMFNNV